MSRADRKVRRVINIMKTLPNQLIMENGIVVIKADEITMDRINSSSKTTVSVKITIGDITQVQL